ncbi:hypothetical protein [Planococcus shenhongbingii]|uniref:Uncharacterized protein n=1 Tax=Planococcus shenhongbingii TaxID=3058398 RepID=A0ABT8NBW0_9BACL|nr:hypothetical protein [Planococcus sp. N017]MDN7245365.1 hypothetical protein [Planococcus sp. N017]
MAKHVKGLSWISFLLVLGGLILTFSSARFGVARGNSWLAQQVEGSDTEIYYRVVETYMTGFMMLGSILFGMGLLIGILTFFTLVLFDETEESSNTEGQLTKSGRRNPGNRFS